MNRNPQIIQQGHLKTQNVNIPGKTVNCQIDAFSSTYPTPLPSHPQKEQTFPEDMLIYFAEGLAVNRIEKTHRNSENRRNTCKNWKTTLPADSPIFIEYLGCNLFKIAVLRGSDTVAHIKKVTKQTLRKHIFKEVFSQNYKEKTSSNWAVL